MDNRISATLTTQAITAITNAVGTIRTNLPFLLSLTEDQRKRMAKGGTKSQGVISQTLAFASQNRDVFPNDFDIDEFAKDGALAAQLTPVAQAIAALDENVNDTLMILNSELYLQTVQAYSFAKVTNRSGQYDAYINQVRPYFTHPRTPASSTPTPPST